MRTLPLLRLLLQDSISAYHPRAARIGAIFTLFGLRIVSLNVSLTIKNITYAHRRICIRCLCIKGYFKKEMRVTVFIVPRKLLLVFWGSEGILGFCTGICLPSLVGILLNIRFCILLFSRSAVLNYRIFSLVKMALIFSCCRNTMIYITTPIRLVCLF